MLIIKIITKRERDVWHSILFKYLPCCLTSSWSSVRPHHGSIIEISVFLILCCGVPGPHSRETITLFTYVPALNYWSSFFKGAHPGCVMKYKLIWHWLIPIFIWIRHSLVQNAIVSVTTPLLISKHVDVITVRYTPPFMRRWNHPLYALKSPTLRCVFVCFKYFSVQEIYDTI